jgi:hypothetical protein
MSKRTIVGVVLAVAASVCVVLALTGTALAGPSQSSSTPGADVVGTGIFNCSSVTGEIGF